MRVWLEREGISEGRLARSVAKGSSIGEGLDPSQVPRIVKTMARRAGLPLDLVDGLSGRSTWLSAAQDMLAAGIELPAILQAGRWKPPAMVNRCGEQLLGSKSAAKDRKRSRRVRSGGDARERSRHSGG